MNDNERHVSRIVTALRWLVIAIIVLAIVLACATIKAAESIGKPVTTTAEAVGWALGDLALLPATDQPYARYVWLPPWADEKWIGALNFTVNTAASFATTAQLGDVIANGWMIRYDLRRLAPDVKQMETLRNVWDGLAKQDAYFHIPATNTGLATAVISPHLSQEQAVALAGLTLSTGAVLRADFLLVKMLTTLDGGQYYNFLQIPRQLRKRADGTIATPLDEWLASLGVFEDVTKTLRADQRAAIFRSNVTGKPRMIAVFYGLNRGGNLVTITFDIADEDVAAGQHPIRNLLAFNFRAREIIVQKPNGTHAFALADNKGNFQDSVPDNIARDHMIPSPHTGRLEPAIGCIRCHGGHDGYQPFANDVQKLLASRIDVFSDLGSGLTREQTVDRLAGLYAGQLDVPDGPIGRGRRDYLTALYRLAGAVDPFTDSNLSIAANLSNQVSTIFAGYRYDMITPERACLEHGLQVGEGEGVAGLKQLLGDVSETTVVDPIVGSLRAGLSVNRAEFESVFVDMALAAEARRTGKTIKEVRPVQKPIAKPVEAKPVTKKR